MPSTCLQRGICAEAETRHSFGKQGYSNHNGVECREVRSWTKGQGQPWSLCSKYRGSEYQDHSGQVTDGGKFKFIPARQADRNCKATLFWSPKSSVLRPRQFHRNAFRDSVEHKGRPAVNRQGSGWAPPGSSPVAVLHLVHILSLRTHYRKEGFSHLKKKKKKKV